MWSKVSQGRSYKPKAKVPNRQNLCRRGGHSKSLGHQGKLPSQSSKMTSLVAATLRRISPALVDTRVYSCVSVLPRTCSAGGNVNALCSSILYGSLSLWIFIGGSFTVADVECGGSKLQNFSFASLPSGGKLVEADLLKCNQELFNQLSTKWQ